MKNKFIFATMLMLFSTLIFGQDKYKDLIMQRGGKVIFCQVREIGDDEIKYVMEGYREDLVFGIDKNKVDKVIFADGREIDIYDSMYGKENYADQRKNAFKFHFFSPLSGATAFSYERSLSPGRSFEVGLGIIGLGLDESAFGGDENGSGAYVNVGYKFIKSPDFYLKGMRYAHLLKGAYFKPEIAISSYSDTPDVWYGGAQNSSKEQVIVAAFMLNIGKQWVFADRFLVDWYVGGGYGFGKNDINSARHYAFTGATEDMPLVVNSGFRIGLLF